MQYKPKTPQLMTYCISVVKQREQDKFRTKVDMLGSNVELFVPVDVVLVHDYDKDYSPMSPLKTYTTYLQIRDGHTAAKNRGLELIKDYRKKMEGET